MNIKINNKVFLISVEYKKKKKKKKKLFILSVY